MGWAQVRGVNDCRTYDIRPPTSGPACNGREERFDLVLASLRTFLRAASREIIAEGACRFELRGDGRLCAHRRRASAARAVLAVSSEERLSGWNQRRSRRLTASQATRIFREGDAADRAVWDDAGSRFSAAIRTRHGSSPS